MAFNLRAVLSLDGSRFMSQMNRIQRQMDQANRQTRLWRDSQGRLRDELGRFARQTDRSSHSMSNFGKAITSPIRAIGSLTSGLGGLVGAYAAASGAKKVFEETIGQAAKYEQSTVMISAMLNDKKLGQDYMKLVDKFAIDSPILDSQGMLGNSKSFLTASKDMKQLEKMWSLAERMAAIDPYQGLEGAVFALRELFSGDAISIVRRFEMPKKVMNDIKNLKLDDQLRELDKYFNKIGMTQQLIDDMGGTTLGVWAQIKESSNVILRSLGAPALLKIREFLKEVRTGMLSVSEVIADRNLFTPEEFRERMNRAMQFESFQESGKKILENVSTGFINAVKGIGGWVEAITSSDAWKQANSLSAKIDVVFSDIWAKFTEWVNGDGKPKIEQVASTLTQILATAISTSTGPILESATVIGESLGKGMIDGAVSYVKQNWGKMIGESFLNSPGMKIVTAPLKLAESAMDAQTNGGFSIMKDKALEHIFPKKNGGLDRVPYNGATYSLHKDEMVLPRGEAAEYRKGNRGGGKTGVMITGNTFNVRQESDIQKVASELARLIEMEGAQMA